VRGLIGAVQFLTRIPIGLSAPVPHPLVIPWFGIVGGGIGLISGGLAYGAAQWLPMHVAAGVGVVAGLLVTGAFHEDGLADISDAFGGGWNREERLHLLKDSQHGTYGVSALVVSIGWRWACAGSVDDSRWLVVGFVLAHALGRAGAVLALFLAPPARDSGLGADVRRGVSVPAVAGGLIGSLTIAVAAALLGSAGRLAVLLVAGSVIATVVGAVLVVRLAVAKIGGLAGDVLGAVEQVAECAVWVTVSAAASAGG
jgi:adenosylcobinamide-GDP ribazoletransferase